MSRRVELTVKQRRALETLAEGPAVAFPAAADARAVDRMAVMTLVDHGLARSGGSRFVITDAGRRWLTTDGGRVRFRMAKPGGGVQGFKGRRGGL